MANGKSIVLYGENSWKFELFSPDESFKFQIFLQREEYKNCEFRKTTFEIDKNFNVLQIHFFNFAQLRKS